MAETLKQEVQLVGANLGSYSSFSWFKKQDFDYLKRKYFLLEISLYQTLNELNTVCGKSVLPVLFFYKIDDDASERVGFILEDLSKAYRQDVFIFSFDIDYPDEPLVPLIASRYNFSSMPGVVMNNVTYSGLHYTGEFNATIIRWQR